MYFSKTIHLRAINDIKNEFLKIFNIKFLQQKEINTMRKSSSCNAITDLAVLSINTSQENPIDVGIIFAKAPITNLVQCV